MKHTIVSLLPLLALLAARPLPAAVPAPIRQLVTAYYTAMEKEDLGAVQKLSAVPEDDPMYKILVGVFLASDCQIRDVRVKDFQPDADGQAGAAFVSLKARVQNIDKTDAFDQERDLVLLLAQQEGQWKVIKVMREMDYRMAARLVRLDEESNQGGPPPITPETFQKLPPLPTPPGGGAATGGGKTTTTAAEQDVARRILGTWHWRHRVVGTFIADGTMYRLKNTSWRLTNANERRFAITFKDGLKADVVMDAEGTVLSGKNSKGGEAWARRLTPVPQWEDKGPGPMVFSDSEFRKESWTIRSTVSGGAGKRLTARRQTPGRGGYRYVRHQLNEAEIMEQHRIGVCHIYWKRLYDPALNGPISSLDYEDTSALLSGHAKGQRGGAMLAQGGIYYYYQPRKGAAVPFVNQPQWKRLQLTGLQAEDFAPADTFGNPDEAVSHPDFSVQGDQIMFGFFRGSLSGMTDEAATTETGIDDWKVTVHRDGTATTPVPERKPEVIEVIPEGWKKIVHRTHSHTYCIPRDWGDVHRDVKGNVIQAYRSPRTGGAYVSVLHVPVAAPLSRKQLEGTIPLSLKIRGLFGRLIDKQPLKVGDTPALLNRFAGTFMGFPTQTLQLVASQKNSLFYLAVVTAANNAKQQETARAIISTFRFAQ